MNPRVSIVVPAYQPGAIFEQTLRSCLEQEGVDLEVVVALDGEDPAVHEAIATVSDPRVRLVADGKRYGQFANFNRAVDASRGEYVKLFSADDLMARDCARTMVEALEQAPTVGLCTSRHITFSSDHAGRIAPRLEIPRTGQSPARVFTPREGTSYLSFWGNQVGGPSNVMFRRDAWWLSGGFDPRVGHLGDHVLWARMVARSGLVLIDRPLVAYRVHDNSVTGRDALRFLRVDEPFSIVDDATLGAWFPGQRFWRRQYLRLGMVNVTVGYALSMVRRAPAQGLLALARVLCCGGPALLPATLLVGAWSAVRSSLLGLGPQWPAELPGSFGDVDLGPQTAGTLVELLSDAERMRHLQSEVRRS